MQAQPFEKDLGYLERFLDKVHEHASALTDRAAGARLAALVEEERARWEEIRGILSGETEAPSKDEAGTSPAPPGEGQAPELDAAERQAAAAGAVPTGGEGAAALRAAPEATRPPQTPEPAGETEGPWTVGPLHG